MANKSKRSNRRADQTPKPEAIASSPTKAMAQADVPPVIPTRTAVKPRVSATVSYASQGNVVTELKRISIVAMILVVILVALYFVLR